jgi:hypothetical protein
MRRLLQFLTGIFLCSCVLQSCTSEVNPNTGVIPSTDSLLLTYSDTTTLVAFIEKDDTLRTDATERVLLGSMYDPVFGRCTSAFYSSFTIAQSLNTLSDVFTVDSVILTMRADGGYGDLSKFTGYQVLEVFELTETIPTPPTGGYNSYSSFNYNPVPLATYGFAPQFFPAGTEPAAIRIPLNPNFGNRFFATQNDTINSTNIADYIKGVYVRINPTVTGMQPPGTGGIAYFKLNSDVSNIKVFYKKNGITQAALKLPMSTTANKRVNIFNHFDYVDADPAVQAKLADTNNTIVSDKLYIQALQGIRIKIKLPYLMNYIDSGPVIVNRAEFVFPIDPTQDLHLYDEPDNIMAYFIGKTDGLIHFMPDIPYTYYDSFYDPINQQYKIVLTQYIQKLLNGENLPHEFYLDIPVLAKYTDAYRLVLNSPEHATSPMQLNLTYTRIPSL